MFPACSPRRDGISMTNAFVLYGSSCPGRGGGGAFVFFGLYNGCAVPQMKSSAVNVVPSLGSSSTLLMRTGIGFGPNKRTSGIVTMSIGSTQAAYFPFARNWYVLRMYTLRCRRIEAAYCADTRVVMKSQDTGSAMRVPIPAAANLWIDASSCS